MEAGYLLLLLLLSLPIARNGVRGAPERRPEGQMTLPLPLANFVFGSVRNVGIVVTMCVY